VTQFLCHFASVSAVLVAVALLVEPLRAGPQATELHAEYRRISEQFAEAAPDWRPNVPSSGSLLFIAADQYTPAGQEDQRYREARNEYADQLFDLAKRAADAGQLSLAFQWATEAVRENPDHADARRVLGYEQRDGAWLTGYGLRMADAGKTWHAKFGWIDAADAARYNAGERLVGGRWLSAADDAARRRDMKHGWQVRTDHFAVTTNHSLEAAAELAARLERLHQVWRQLFAGFYLSEREVRELFAGRRQPRKRSRPFRVYYHRDSEQYAAELRRRQPRIAETLGIYFDDRREAHFFADDVAAGGSPAVDSTGGPPVATDQGEPPVATATSGPPLPTLYHEAVHQLFQESRPAARRIGNDANFWIIEGVATYFETLSEHADPQAGLYFTVGQATAGRLPAARERLLDGFYVPLAELVRMGKSDIQQHPEIAKLYSQAAGLSAFLMDAQQGRYREPLVRYLKAVYAGRDDEQSLADAASASYHELDAHYRRYIESLP